MGKARLRLAFLGTSPPQMYNLWHGGCQWQGLLHPLSFSHSPGTYPWQQTLRNFLPSSLRNSLQNSHVTTTHKTRLSVSEHYKYFNCIPVFHKGRACRFTIASQDCCDRVLVTGSLLWQALLIKQPAFKITASLYQACERREIVLLLRCFSSCNLISCT